MTEGKFIYSLNKYLLGCLQCARHAILGTGNTELNRSRPPPVEKSEVWVSYHQMDEVRKHTALATESTVRDFSHGLPVERKDFYLEARIRKLSENS